MTWWTSRSNGTIPVLGAQSPKILARWQSQVARYCRAPPRRYSCSTRMARDTPAGRLGWHRHRAWMLVFSSAEITYSSFASGDPSNSPAYRSSTRAALASKSGSRGKIQERKVHGRMASSSSQRQMVASEMEATIPRRSTSARMSGTNRRDRGTRSVAGSSQAIALTSTTTCGGKDRRPAAAGALLQPLQALLEEPLAPHGHHVAGGVQAQGDLVVVHPLGGHEHDPGPEDVTIRRRIPPGALLQGLPRRPVENDLVRALSRHRSPPLGGNHSVQLTSV